MYSFRQWVLVAASTMVSVTLHAGGFADAVVDYVPGNGVSSDYTQPASALGAPARETPGPFGGPVDPFAPPYLSTQVVSVGEGGSLTVRFNTPIDNTAAHPFGIDFLIFGNAGLRVTNALDENSNFIGTPATDGTLFGQNPGETRVWVSADNTAYYLLDPTRAPAVDALLPTDGAGDFFTPADPSLTGDDFAGLTLADVRARYAGSAGGAGFDLSWAQDDHGQSVNLEKASFVRVEVLSGKSDIDALVVVPEPAGWSLAGVGAMAGWWMRRRKRSARKSV